MKITTARGTTFETDDDGDLLVRHGDGTGWSADLLAPFGATLASDVKDLAAHALRQEALTRDLTVELQALYDASAPGADPHRLVTARMLAAAILQQLGPAGRAAQVPTSQPSPYSETCRPGMDFGMGGRR